MTSKQFGKVWGYRVRRQRLAQNMTMKQLAAEVGITDRGLWALEHGRTFPRYTSACAIAEALNDPMLVDMIHNRRRKDCTICGKSFLNLSDTDRKVMCGSACKKVYQMRKTRSYEESYRENKMSQLVRALSRTEKAVKKLELAVTSMCQGCEPMGVCKDGGCPLRTVSPFPLRERIIA